MRVGKVTIKVNAARGAGRGARGAVRAGVRARVCECAVCVCTCNFLLRSDALARGADKRKIIYSFVL